MTMITRVSKRPFLPNDSYFSNRQYTLDEALTFWNKIFSDSAIHIFFAHPRAVRNLKGWNCEWWKREAMLPYIGPLSFSSLRPIPLLDGHFHRLKKQDSNSMDIEKKGRELQTWRTKSMAWKNTAEAKATVLDLTIKNMAKNEGKIPTQLLEPVNNIIMISSDIEVFVIIRLY